MVLYLDFRNASQDAGLVDANGSVKWLHREVRRGEFELLSEVASQFGLLKKNPQAIVAAVWPEGAPDVSWSTARTAVTVANTLSFAWRVPAVGLEISEIKAEDLPSAIWNAAMAAEPEGKLEVLYSGDPNISQPKNIF